MTYYINHDDKLYNKHNTHWNEKQLIIKHEHEQKTWKIVNKNITPTNIY